VRRPGPLTEADLERIVNGDVVGGSAIPDQAQALRYRVVRGVTIGPDGQLADYKIQWQLDRPSDQGGWIVQNVRTRSTVSDAWGNPMWPPGNFAPGNGYCEAWPVAPGATGTGRPVWDDMFNFAGGGPGTTGSTTETGVARFYEGLPLPSRYKPFNVDPAGNLAATWSCPSLPTAGATPPVVRSVTVSW
jgi:hypothetical protein